MQDSKKILITGGSGTIGQRLTQLLVKRGHHVSHLGRSKRDSRVKTFLWNPEKKDIDAAALRDVDVIVHLAGAGIADKRWNEGRKREILVSRTGSTRLLNEALSGMRHKVKTFVSASGISFYGLDACPRGTFVESDLPASDFMAVVAVAWEKEVNEMPSSIRKVMIRTGVVLSRNGGALEKLAMPIRYFVGAPLGSGQQVVNWIHLDDLCGIYMKAIDQPQLSGPFNAVAPNPVTNKELTREIARILKRPLWLPPVPGFVVQAIAGGVAEIVLNGGKISSEKIESTGFKFQFSTVGEALVDLLQYHRTSGETANSR